MEIKKLNNICDVRDGTHASPKQTPTGKKLITSKHLKDGYIDISSAYFISEKDFMEINKRSKVDKWDILISMIGTVGNVALVKEEPDFAIKNVCLIKTNSNEILAKYLFAFFRSPYAQNQLKSKMTGASQQYVTLDSFRSFDIIINNKTQNKIAKVLSNYDDLIENNNKRIKILEDMAQKIYKEWFVDFKFPGHENTKFKQTELGLIPENWAYKKLSSLIKVKKGKSYKSSDLSDTSKNSLPFLTLKSIERDGGFRRDGIKWFCGECKEENKAYRNDIIMAMTDMTQERRIVGRCARVSKCWHEEYVMSMDLIKIEPNDIQISNYIYTMLRFSSFPNTIKHFANGANVLHLAPKCVEDYTCYFPTDILMKLFSEKIDNTLHLIDALEEKNDNLKQTRDLLLPKLISGEIDIESLEIV